VKNIVVKILQGSVVAQCELVFNWAV